MHALTPSGNFCFFLRSSALQQRDKWNIQHQKCCSAKSLHKIVHGIFTHLYLLSSPWFLKHLSHYCATTGRGLLKKIITMDWKSIFLGVFFSGKMLPLSFPEPNLTNETQKYSVACWFSKRVHCRWEVLHYTYRNYRYAREFWITFACSCTCLILPPFFTQESRGAKKIIFTACHLGKLKLAFTSLDVISTSPKNFLTRELIMIWQFFCYLNSSKNITCPSGKLKTEFTSPIAKSTSPGLSDTTFFAP